MFTQRTQRLYTYSRLLSTWGHESCQSINAMGKGTPCPPRDSGVQPVLKWSHMKQSERRDCSYGCHMPQEPLKQFQRSHSPASERTQAVQHWLGALFREARLHTHRVYSTPRKEIICAGESLLFSQLTRSPNWLRCRSTRSLWSHNCSRVRAMLETVEDPDAHFP